MRARYKEGDEWRGVVRSGEGSSVRVGARVMVRRSAKGSSKGPSECGSGS